MKELIAIIIFFFIHNQLVFAEELQFSGYIAVQDRYFFNAPISQEQLRHNEASIAMRPEWFYETQTDQFSFIPFYRYETKDKERRHFDIREAFWRHIGDNDEWLIGVNKVFWGVAESNHLVDIINQTDLVEDIDFEDKLGQFMINYTTIQNWGEASIFVMPHFRERTYPGSNGRLRLPLTIDVDHAQYESSKEQYHLDLAIRYSHVIDDWDFGAYYFYGTSREPRLLPNWQEKTLIPYYDIIQQFGTDIQFTHNEWLYKFEGLVRKGHGDTFYALVAGFEYTIYQLFNTNSDLGLLFEYSYDGRDETAPVTLFQNDVFLGVRLAFNNTQDTSILAGVVIDTEEHDRFFNFEAEHRFTDHIKAELQARVFDSRNDTGQLSMLEKDDYVQLNLFYYF